MSRRSPTAAAFRWLVLLSALAVLLAACGDTDDEAGSDELLVVATTTILGDVVANVVGDEARVVVLTPIGADPHDFQASAAQVARINEADLVVANGLFLEEGLEDVLDAAVDDGVNVLEVAPLLDPLPFAGEDDHDDDHADDDATDTHEHGSLDPHVWLDPLRMAVAAGLIADELATIDSSIDWVARSDAYADRLTTVDAEIDQTLSAIPTDARRLVTNHGSLGYFADRYAFEVIATVVPAGTALGDPSSEELATLIDVMRDEGVSVIFAETTRPSDLADAIAAELGESVQVVALYTGSLGESGSGADTYIGMLETNADRIAVALGG